MKFVLITGMARSGTTLLDKLLENLPSGHVASQPLPLLFIELKKVFYEKIGHPEKYYVLNHHFREKLYTPEDLADFLSSYPIPEDLLFKVFRDEGKYSGQQRTYQDPRALARRMAGFRLAEVLERLLLEIFGGEQDYLGLKEIYIEEYIPYFRRSNWEVAVILRDLRSVVASMNSGRGSIYTGSIKPSLFHIRNWRKSYKFWSMPEVYSVRFEGLIQNPSMELADLISQITSTSQELKWPEVLIDEFGQDWKANSSHNALASHFSEKLTRDQVVFFESYAAKELMAAGYALTQVVEALSSIEDLPLEEPFEVDDERLSLAYSDSENQRLLEWSEMREA